MLLDNKTKIEDKEHYKVFDFIKNYTESGSLDIVTGFFSVTALALMKDHINRAKGFRLILGNLMREGVQLNKVIDLLSGNTSISGTLSLSKAAQEAVEFLKQEEVQVKLTQQYFCHAKAYIYEDKDPRKNFYIIGSSNLTEAGLGIKESSNIELNIASTGASNDYKELKNWFGQLWEGAADKIKLSDETEVEVKQYIIQLIENLFKEYTPYDLYYKVLYELFKDDLLELSGDAEFKREIAHLEESVIYKTLFPYQQKGVISLIKMLQKYNGAILADAVGLGKTWTALAVMKYFQMRGYTVVVFCPKRLRNNWEQYQSHRGSRFEKDELEYYVRNHTDLQDDRLSKNYPDFPLSKLQRKRKLLLVIDESHNFRNDKSSRYRFLVDNILLPEKANRDVKVLLLSATPINNKLMDIRNQFKLMTKGRDDGFRNTDLQIDSLENIFRIVQEIFSEWVERDNKKIADLVAKLPRKFEKLTDALIMARTRKLIEGEFGGMNFPKKEAPINEFVTPEIGDLKSIDDILDAISINLTAYRPADYIKNITPKSVLEDEQQRQKFLVKMMYILLVKRLESSWSSFARTVENILNYHIQVLNKVEQFIKQKGKIDSFLEDNLTEEDNEEIEEAAAESNQPIMLGKRNPVPLPSITDIKLFKKHLEEDIEKLSRLKDNLVKYEADFNAGRAHDSKLNRLVEHITTKQQQSENKKVLVFTVYEDTARFLYNQLKKRGIKNVAFVSGSISEADDGYSGSNFEPILERFAPFTKLYKEKDWSELYERANLSGKYKDGDKWNVPYDKWIELITKHDKATLHKIENPIDVLIATDCLSEGQNLQDCDMVINYDIHWNPVRLIQRMGRIDRIGSPNKTIKGINFWPGKDFEDYLRLKSRVENRMALMTLVGTQLEEQMTPELEKIVEENPLLPKQAQKMLEQLQITWDDVEVGDKTLGLNDLSLEQFRQELFEFFKKNAEFFKKIPNGVFTGFKFKPNAKWKSMPNSIVAVLGYPKRPDEAKDHTYNEIHLLHLSIEDGEIGKSVLSNNQEILTLLRFHKSEPRYVPADIDRGEQAVLDKLAEAIRKGLEAQITPVAVNHIRDLFTRGAAPKNISPDQKNLEDKFKSENFDLITWFVVSNG